jgi:anaerobic selenocysteine-containing dehydrogenase
MDRRNFLRKLTAAGTAAATTAIAAGASAAPVAPKETRSVTYNVRGFTCVTCSVGLEVMLRGLNGVTRANASYPAHNVVIGFDEHMTNEKTLKEFVTVCGFSVA